jgi:hypothetical protein
LISGNPRSRHDFVELSLPDRFILEVPVGDGWIEHGRYEADAFQRQPDGSYLCAGHGGSPTYLRCVLVRSDGGHQTFRLVPLP